jgi:hypothetical protein
MDHFHPAKTIRRRDFVQQCTGCGLGERQPL